MVFVFASPGAARAKLRQAPGQAVARALELLEVHQSGPAGRGARGAGRDEREALRDDPRELGLELGDLSAQHRAGGPIGLCAAVPARRMRRPGPGGEAPPRGNLAIDDRLLVLGQDPFSSGRLEARSLPAPPGAPPRPQVASRALAELHSASSA